MCSQSRFFDPLRPRHHSQRAGNHARQSAVCRNAFPQYRQNHNRTERRAETCPRIRHQAQNFAFGVGRNQDGDHSNRQHHQTTHPHQLFLRRIFTQKAFVEVFGNRAGANQKLARQSGHDRRQNRAQNNACNPRVEQQSRKRDEDTFVVALHGSGLVGIGTKIRNAEITDRYCTCQTQHHPSHTDAACGYQRFRAFSRHKARQNVRLTEIAQAPCGGGNNADDGRTGKQTAVFLACTCGNILNCGRHLVCPPQTQIDHYRRQNQRKNHQRSLQRICPAYRQKAAQEGIGNGCTRTQPHRLIVSHAFKQALEQSCTRHNARGAINREEKQNNQRGNHFHQVSARTEAVEEIIRQRQRVIGIFGMHAQTARHQKPVEIRADHQTDGNPSFIQTAQINRAGQTH